MARLTIGQEGFSFSASNKGSDLDELVALIDWSEAGALMAPISLPLEASKAGRRFVCSKRWCWRAGTIRAM